MIDKFIDIAKNLNFSTIDALCEAYDENAVFVHPFNTVRGRKAIARQWKMSLKYCPNTSIHTYNITKDVGHNHNVHNFDWCHSFDLPSGKKSINGHTTICTNKAGLITIQIDTFDLLLYYTLFKDDTEH